MKFDERFDRMLARLNKVGDGVAFVGAKGDYHRAHSRVQRYNQLNSPHRRLHMKSWQGQITITLIQLGDEQITEHEITSWVRVPKKEAPGP